MPKAELHWAHDLLAAALVGAVSGLVFWLVPPAAQATPALAQQAATVLPHPSEHHACNAAIS
jgi:membrane-associated phospholipid phosphatase